MNSIREAEAIFFDLDDTLYDHLMPFHMALKHCNLNLPAAKLEEVFKRVRYYSDVLWKVYTKGEISLDLLRIERLRYAFNEFGILLSKEQAKAIQERYVKEQQQIKAFPEILSFIQNLMKCKPIVGILTNGPADHQMNKIKILQIDQIIPKERIFISDSIGLAKPDKRVFQYIQKQMNIEPNKCCYIGDTWKNDIVPSIEAGWQCIWFNHRKRKPESHHIPHEIIMNYHDIFI
ncbi:HAD family hydrolase [Metabacillus arenae]|uniref:HAD family hydrolase n=1 Tax=Metabacillus arenae TaxID=2771434 RepID=A0A926RWS9_9BACI|nr:HAD family hydrolase [Metabacillus arenae]MBD1379457.1 HAD family hydrolase [Metabacillus arenae]